MSRTNPQQQASQAPHRWWHIATATGAGLLWLAVAAMGLGLTLGYDWVPVGKYDEQVFGEPMVMRFGWPWPYLDGYPAPFYQPRAIWSAVDEVIWFSAAALVADLALWLLLVSALGWLLLRWYRRGWRVHLGGFLLLVGLAACFFSPFALSVRASLQGHQLIRRLAQMEQQDALKIRRMMAKYPEHKVQLPKVITDYEIRFLWLWDLLDTRPPQWAQTPVSLTIITANVPRALALASELPTLQSLSVWVISDNGFPDIVWNGPPADAESSSEGSSEDNLKDGSEERFENGSEGESNGSSENNPEGRSEDEGETNTLSGEEGLQQGGPFWLPLELPEPQSAGTPLFQSQDFWKPDVDRESLRRLQKLPRLKYLLLCVNGPWSDECVAELARLPRLVSLDLWNANHRSSRPAVSDCQLRLLWNHRTLKQISVDTKIISPQIKEELRRRGIKLFAPMDDSSF